MSPTVQTIPDIKAIVSTYLREHPDVVALDAKVMGRSPSDSLTPWVKVTYLDGADASAGTEHLIDHLFQFDCYAGKTAMDAHTGDAEASLLGRTVRAVLWAAKGQVLDGGDEPDVVMTNVRFIGMPEQDDIDFEPARARYILSAEIHAHPA